MRLTTAPVYCLEGLQASTHAAAHMGGGGGGIVPVPARLHPQALSKVLQKILLQGGGPKLVQD